MASLRIVGGQLLIWCVWGWIPNVRRTFRLEGKKNTKLSNETVVKLLFTGRKTDKVQRRIRMFTPYASSIANGEELSFSSHHHEHHHDDLTGGGLSLTPYAG